MVIATGRVVFGRHGEAGPADVRGTAIRVQTGGWFVDGILFNQEQGAVPMARGGEGRGGLGTSLRERGWSSWSTLNALSTNRL